MPHFVCDAAVDHVLEKPVPVRRHGDEVAPFPRRGVGDLSRRIAAGEQGVRLDAVRAQRRARLLEILAIEAHFLGLAQMELFHIARRPTVGDMNQHDGRMTHRGERAYVLDDGVIVIRVLERNENAPVHQLTHPRMVCTSSHTLSTAMMNATAHASVLSQTGFAKRPIFARSDVNCTKGITAKDSCKLRTTWLSMRSCAVPLSP